MFTTKAESIQTSQRENETIQNCLNRFKSAQMQIDMIQTFLNRLNGMENKFWATGSSLNHPKNLYFDLQHTQNDKNYFP